MQIYAVVHSPVLAQITWRHDKLCRHTQRHGRRHNTAQAQTISVSHFRSQATSLLLVTSVLHDNAPLAHFSFSSICCFIATLDSWEVMTLIIKHLYHEAPVAGLHPSASLLLVILIHLYLQQPNLPPVTNKVSLSFYSLDWQSHVWSVYLGAEPVFPAYPLIELVQPHVTWVEITSISPRLCNEMWVLFCWRELMRRLHCHFFCCQLIHVSFSLWKTRTFYKVKWLWKQTSVDFLSSQLGI